MEKEAYTIIEALKRWKHLLLGKHLNFETKQRNVLFKLDQNTIQKLQVMKF